MKKRAMLLLAFAILLSFSSCGNQNASKGDTAQELKITDSFTHQDPDDIPWTNRYATAVGEGTETEAYYESTYDVDFKQEIVIVYGDAEDTLLSYYDYFLFGSEDDASRFSDAYSAETGISLTGSGTLVMRTESGDALQETVDLYTSMIMLTDTTASGFSAMYNDMLNNGEMTEFSGN